MAQYEGIGERIRQCLVRIGYEKNGRADILRFSMEHRFLTSNVYRWINADVLPERENLFKLAEIFQVKPSWLVFGDEDSHHGGSRAKRGKPTPVSGGSGGHQALAAGRPRGGRHLLPQPVGLGRQGGSIMSTPKRRVVRVMQQRTRGPRAWDEEAAA